MHGPSWLRRDGAYVSNDAHVIALAQVSGARLLYSNDSDLQDDFKDKSLIDSPRGRIYTTERGRRLQPHPQGPA